MLIICQLAKHYKQIILLSIFAFVDMPFIRAQNWRPINPEYSYNYYDPVKDSTFSLRVYQKWVAGKDSSYLMNYKVEDCQDSRCKKLALQRHANFIHIRRSNSFLRLRALITDYSWHFLDNDDSIMLIPTAHIGDSWRFNKMLKASIKLISLMDFLGIQDSVKTIVTDNNDTILLSKKYGILRFPLFDKDRHSYLLKGVEGPDIGFHFPYIQDVYNYNTGDSFEYHVKYSYPVTIESFHFDDTTRASKAVLQYYIADKQINMGVLTYKVKGYIFTESGRLKRADTNLFINFNDIRFQGANAYKGQYLNKYSKNGRIFALPVDTFTNPRIKFGLDTFALTGAEEPDYVSKYYVEGLGLASYGYFTQSSTCIYELVAYRKKDTAVGVFTRLDTNLVSIEPSFIGVKTDYFKLRTNPSSGNNLLEYKLDNNLEINISITDVDGRLHYRNNGIKLKEGIGTLSIDPVNLKSGIYFIRISSGALSQVIRMVKL